MQAAAGREVLHPDSKVEVMRARLRELDQPIYGTKEALWTRLSRAERVNREHQEKIAELRLRHQQAVEEGPQIAPRMVAGPNEPTPEEREAHNLLHMTQAAWCESCMRGNQTTKPHRNLTYDQKEIGASKILLDFAYLKTDGEWGTLGDVEPPAAELFATTLIMVDSDTDDSGGLDANEGRRRVQHRQCSRLHGDFELGAGSHQNGWRTDDLCLGEGREESSKEADRLGARQLEGQCQHGSR